MPIARQQTFRSVVRYALLVSLIAAPLAGCGAQIASLPLVGEPANAPARPADPGTFPAVHDMPMSREEKTMTPAEVKQLQQELNSARDNQIAVQTIDAFKPAAATTSNAKRK